MECTAGLTNFPRNAAELCLMIFNVGGVDSGANSSISAAARIKILSAQVAMERPEIQTPEQIAECAAARITQTAELDNLTGKESTIAPTTPVKEYDFVAAAKFCEAEYNRQSENA